MKTKRTAVCEYRRPLFLVRGAAFYVVRPFTWCGLLRGAVLPGRKDERSEASRARVRCAVRVSRKEAKTQREQGGIEMLLPN